LPRGRARFPPTPGGGGGSVSREMGPGRNTNKKCRVGRRTAATKKGLVPEKDVPEKRSVEGTTRKRAAPWPPFMKRSAHDPMHSCLRDECVEISNRPVLAAGTSEVFYSYATPNQQRA